MACTPEGTCYSSTLGHRILQHSTWCKPRNHALIASPSTLSAAFLCRPAGHKLGSKQAHHLWQFSLLHKKQGKVQPSKKLGRVVSMLAQKARRQQWAQFSQLPRMRWGLAFGLVKQGIQ